MLSSGNKGTSKAPILPTRRDIMEKCEYNLRENMSNHCQSIPSSEHLLPVSSPPTVESNSAGSYSPLSQFIHPFIDSDTTAVLVGFSPVDIWNVEDFIQSLDSVGAPISAKLRQELLEEFGPNGRNEAWCSTLISPSCTIGRTCKVLNCNTLYPIKFSFAAGQCNIGGLPYCCESAARIQYLPTSISSFQIIACNTRDIVILNGKRITPDSGAFPLCHNDVCSVGFRVFVFTETNAQTLSL